MAKVKERQTHPFKVLIGFNEAMQQWDLNVMIGGFKSKEEADAFAKYIAEFLAGERGSAHRLN